MFSTPDVIYNALNKSMTLLLPKIGIFSLDLVCTKLPNFSVVITTSLESLARKYC